MKIGQMRHVIHLQKPLTVINDGGTPVESWQPFATLRAARLSGGLSETVSDAGAEDRQALRVRTRHVSGVRPDMRLILGGDAFNVRRVEIIGHDQFLEIEADRVEV